MGSVPDWYLLMKEAQFMGVAPWLLLEQPVIWRKWARMASSAEAEAQRQKNASRARKGK
jgi:hypothetical protein